jgi:DNA-binding protein YbaB
MDKALDESMRRVRELLDAHVDKDLQISETIGGLVTAIVDARLQLTSIEIHDKSMDPTLRSAIEGAVVGAVNGARLKAAQAAGESLQGLQDSGEWKKAMDSVFKRNATSK